MIWMICSSRKKPLSHLKSPSGTAQSWNHSQKWTPRIPSKDRFRRIYWNRQKASLWQEQAGNTRTGTRAHRSRGDGPGSPTGICLCLLFAAVAPKRHLPQFSHAGRMCSGVRWATQTDGPPPLVPGPQEEKCARRFGTFAVLLSLVQMLFVLQKCWKDGGSNFTCCFANVARLHHLCASVC